jgi:lysophospholipase L1-like esterase
MAPVWRPLPAFGFGLILALALDQAIRLFLPPEPTIEERPWYLRTVQYHPILGWSGYPNVAETNDGISVQTNSLGYRDREPVEVEGQKLRVLFLGDSFTWGDEVRLEERFTSLLEASCGLQCDRLPPIHAINKGIIGYGTAQSFLQYVLTRNEHRFELVILALFTGNDLTDNADIDSHSGPRPRLIRCDPESGQELCLEGVPIPAVVDWPEHRLLSPRGEIVQIFGWSGLIALASRRRSPRFLSERRIVGQMTEALNALPFPIVERTSDRAIEDRIGQLEAILKALDRTTRGEGKAFGVLPFPSARVYAGDAGDELRDYREIVGMLGRLHIPFVDYYEKTKDSRWEDLFFGLQDHWQPSGHQEAAKLLRPLLIALRAGDKPMSVPSSPGSLHEPD